MNNNEYDDTEVLETNEGDDVNKVLNLDISQPAYTNNSEYTPKNLSASITVSLKDGTFTERPRISRNLTADTYDCYVEGLFEQNLKPSEPKLPNLSRTVYKRPMDRLKEKGKNGKRYSDTNPFGFTPYDDGKLSGNYSFTDRLEEAQHIISELDELESRNG